MKRMVFPKFLKIMLRFVTNLIYYFSFTLFFCDNTSPANNKTGKRIATPIPTRRLLENALETNPTSVGPPEQPKSPANARSANNTVPPLRKDADALLNVPGHIIPTEKPQIAQPASSTAGIGTNAIIRYEQMQSSVLNFINRSRSILSPYFP